MKLRQLNIVLSVAFMSLFLVACGGGGSPSSPFPGNNVNVSGCNVVNGTNTCPPGSSSNVGSITVDNAKQVASSVVQDMDGMDRLGEVIVRLGKIIALYTAASGDPNTTYGDTNTDHELISAGTQPCENADPGSAYTLTWRYVTPANANLDKDTYTFEFNDCEFEGQVLNGNIALTAYETTDPYTGPADPSWDLTATVVFSNNTAMNRAGNVNDVLGFTGLLPGFTVSYDSSSGTRTQFSANVQLSDLGQGGGTTEQLTSFQMIVDDNPTPTVTHRWSNLAGTLSSSVTGGNLTLSMPTATVDWLGSNSTPSAGTIDTQSSDLFTSMEIFVNTTTSVQLTVSDSQSTAPPDNVNTTWSDLLAGTNL